MITSNMHYYIVCVMLYGFINGQTRYISTLGYKSADTKEVQDYTINYKYNMDVCEIGDYESGTGEVGRSAFRCLLCVEGYYISRLTGRCVRWSDDMCERKAGEGKCLQCRYGYFIDADTGQCDACSEGCAVCGGTDFCHACYADFKWWDGKCFKVPEVCGDHCEDPNHHEIGCRERCGFYTVKDSKGSDACPPGFYSERKGDGERLSCRKIGMKGCKDGDGTSCRECFPGSIMSLIANKNVCASCSKKQPCDSCEKEFKCSKCPEGTFVDSNDDCEYNCYDQQCIKCWRWS